MDDGNRDRVPLMYDQGYDDEEDLSEATTTDLVNELFLHGKHLLKVEARRLKRELGEVSDDGRASLAEARARVARGVKALKSDLQEQKHRATAAVKPMATGGVLLHAGVLVLLASLTLGLSTFMAPWLAALIVGVIAAGAGALFLNAGANAVKKIGRNAFVRTNREMTEDKRWMIETKESWKAKLKTATQELKSGVEFPRLRPS